MTAPLDLSGAGRHLLGDAVSALPAGASALWIADAPADALPTGADWHWRTPAALLAEPWQQRHALAVTLLPPTLAPRDALHLLSALRDLHARQLLAFVPVTTWGWQDDTLLALALQRQARFEQDGTLYEAWSYDIRTYKAVPDWLNPRFWANPDNWNKYRW
ncbi:DUF6231 family protein [Amnimonas aquatica]|uniref:DUF6231 family protein n=1 Tax=Amnimonas aquatica TaxID=2094561 RepID=UPI001304996B|nr:DUF6231 family protein [Amnimonas aquatica]